jgi:hypothetical protein
MSGPVHNDVEGTIADFRKLCADTAAEARAKAKTDTDRLFVDTQIAFQEVLIAANRAMMEAENSGIPRTMIAKVAGITLGTLHAQNTANFYSSGDADTYYNRYMQTAEDTLRGRSANAVVGAVNSRSTVGGHA